MKFDFSLRSLVFCGFVVAMAASSAAAPLPEPTRYTAIVNVAFGAHPRQRLDFYRPISEKPMPVVILIHGGGWCAGYKESQVLYSMMLPCLDAGIAFVAIDYRYVMHAQLDGVQPPVKGPFDDAARALQFVRSKAREWNIDKERIAMHGGSAGACSALWVALHDDLADPKSADPVARESSRPWCVAVNNAQTSLDPKQLREWTPNSRYGGHAFGFFDPRNATGTRDSQFEEFLAHREELLPWIKEYSPYELVSKDDPPAYLYYGTPPAMGQEVVDPTHTSNYGVKFQERCKEAGVECELVYPGAPDVRHPTVFEYVVEKLKEPPAK